jgi:hypothetical protein
MSETYTRDLFAWLDQVCADHKLPPSAFKVAYKIGQYINRKSGKAWPSQPTLAKKVGLTVRTVRDLTDQLEAAGHLEIEPHRGRNQTNIYRLAKVSDTVQPDAGKEEADFPLSDEDNRKPASAFEDGKLGNAEPRFYTAWVKRQSRRPHRHVRSAPDTGPEPVLSPWPRKRRQCAGT